VLNALLQGILLGGLYALFAMGLAVIYGVMRLVNIAHGDLIVLAAYATLSVAALLHAGPFVAIPIVIAGFAVLGYVMQRGLLNRVLGADVLPPLVVTYGLSLVIQNVLLQAYSADARSLDVGGLATASLHVGGGIALGVMPLLVFGVALAVAAVLEYVFGHTRLGMAFRATADDRATVRLLGLDDGGVYAAAAAISFAVVAIAGLFMGIKTTFTPDLGPNFLLYAFEAVVISGLGSFWGTFVGAILLGVAQSIGFAINPGWGILAGHFVFLAVLLWRPTGLFARSAA
jgi:branched-chain amino acid transport system permease protein